MGATSYSYPCWTSWAEKTQLFFFPFNTIYFPPLCRGHLCSDLYVSSVSDALTCGFSLCSNCLFRALGDQLEGHSRNHLRHRQETVDYMIKQREDFEPFVEDDVPFDKHGTVSAGRQRKALLCYVIKSHLSTFLINISSCQNHVMAPL